METSAQNKSVAPRRKSLVEVFAGASGLTRAVQARGIDATSLSDFVPNYDKRTGFNFLKMKHDKARRAHGRSVRYFYVSRELMHDLLAICLIPLRTRSTRANCMLYILFQRARERSMWYLSHSSDRNLQAFARIYGQEYGCCFFFWGGGALCLFSVSPRLR